jgi:hypothetical protein
MKKVMPRFVPNLPGALAALFAIKDFLVFLFFAKHEASIQNEFAIRLALLPGSLLFEGFALWFAFVFNILFGALVGWTVLMAYRRAK